MSDVASPPAPHGAELPPPSSAGTRFPGWWLPAIAAASTGLWLVLARWYGLLPNASHTHFAFGSIAGHTASPIMRWTLVVFVLITALYGLGAWVLQRQSVLTPWSRAGVIAAFLGPAAVNVFLYPVGALDVFNYLIELKLTFFYGQNPYLETFYDYRSDPFALPAFLTNVKLFYGPAWLLLSGIGGAITGYTDPIPLLIALKIGNLLLIALTAAILFQIAGKGARGWLAAFLYAANPLVLFEGIANAHNDVLLTVFLVLALFALFRRSLLTGPWLALSVLVKFFTAALAPLFLVAMMRAGMSWRRILASALLALAVSAALIAPFWASGDMVAGMQQGTVKSQEMDHVSPLSLAKQLATARRGTLPAGFPPFAPPSPCRSGDTSSLDTKTMSMDDWLACYYARPSTSGLQQAIERGAAGLFVVLTLLIALTVHRGADFLLGATATMMVFTLLVTNLYPWYLLPIFATLILLRNRAATGYLVIATGLGLVYYPMYIWARFDSGLSEFAYHLFLALFLTAPMLVYLGHATVRLVQQARRPGATAHVARGGDPALSVAVAD